MQSAMMKLKQTMPCAIRCAGGGNPLRYALLIILLLPFIGYGKYVTFVTKDKEPIADVHCTGYSAENDSIASWISDKNGIIDIQTKGVDYILASHPDFNDRLIFSDVLNSDKAEVLMTPAVELKELVVTPSDVEEFATHTTYRISHEKITL